jgi:hypothetical protein
VGGFKGSLQHLVELRSIRLDEEVVGEASLEVSAA